MSKPHLLYVGFFFPPSRASGVFRAVAAVNAFVKAGWDVTVVTTTDRFFEEEIGSVDNSLLTSIPEGVKVVRVPFSFANGVPTTKLRSMSRSRANFPQLWNAVRKVSGKYRNWWTILSGNSRESFQIQDNYVTWIDPVVTAIRKEAAQHPVDHILATGNPYSSFEAARIVGQLISVPFSIDYRDPWMIDMRTEGPANLTPATKQAEERIVAGAASCFHVNEAIKSAYQTLYPDFESKHHVVLNGFDASSVALVPAPTSGGPLTFGMLGTVTDLWPLGPIFEAWGRIRGELPSGSELVLGGHLGYFSRNEAALKSELPDGNFGFRYAGPIQKDQVSEFYRNVDVVIVPAHGMAMVTTGKIFEAVGLGVPVICVQNLEGGAHAILQDHAFGFSAAPEADAVELAFRRAVAAATSLTAAQISDARQRMAHFERPVAMETMVSVVASLTTGAK